MLDCGASCNFVSLDLVRTLGLSVSKIDKYSVRLADGKMLNTVGKVTMNIKFAGGLKYASAFYVMECDVPLILGMQFFNTV